MNFDASPTCPLGLATDELSRWRDGDLPAGRMEDVASHLAGCVACQIRLAGYDRIADGLKAIPTPVLDVSRFWADLRARTSNVAVARGRIAGMGDKRQTFIGLGAVAAVLLIALGFAQLFASQPGPITGPSVTSTHPATATSTATSTPTAGATPTTSAQGIGIPMTAGCPEIGTHPNHVAVGALSTSIPQRELDYPSELMPNDVPNAPYQLPTAASAELQAGIFNPDPPVNPHLSSGYEIQMCNQTGASHTVTGLNVTIASFASSSGPTSVWHICGDGPYDSATKQTSPGCGGGIGDVVFLTATLPSDHTGATAPATASADLGGFNLPITIGPNESTILLVAVQGLTSQGTYALTFDIGVDGAAITSLAPSDGSFLIAPSATIWTGTACLSAAMQAQIPAATQDTYYVCPPTS